jgi:hypothetical protein
LPQHQELYVLAQSHARINKAAILKVAQARIFGIPKSARK